MPVERNRSDAEPANGSVWVNRYTDAPATVVHVGPDSTGTVRVLSTVDDQTGGLDNGWTVDAWLDCWVQER